MESIARDVKNLESDERRLYESVVGHALDDNQRVIIYVVELKETPDEPDRRQAGENFHRLCRQGTEHRERRGISLEEADQALDEAIRAARSQETT